MGGSQSSSSNASTRGGIGIPHRRDEDLWLIDLDNRMLGVVVALSVEGSDVTQPSVNVVMKNSSLASAMVSEADTDSVHTRVL